MLLRRVDRCRRHDKIVIAGTVYIISTIGGTEETGYTGVRAIAVPRDVPDFEAVLRNDDLVEITT